MGLPGAGVKGQAALLAIDRRSGPQLFVDGLHFVPHADGTLAIGSTSERDWTDPAATDAGLDALIERARAALPVLVDARVIERWAGSGRGRRRGPQSWAGIRPGPAPSSPMAASRSASAWPR